jgi:hypothetical protein
MNAQQLMKFITVGNFLKPPIQQKGPPTKGLGTAEFIRMSIASASFMKEASFMIMKEGGKRVESIDIMIVSQYCLDLESLWPELVQRRRPVRR